MRDIARFSRSSCPELIQSHGVGFVEAVYGAERCVFHYSHPGVAAGNDEFDVDFCEPLF